MESDQKAREQMADVPADQKDRHRDDPQVRSGLLTAEGILRLPDPEEIVHIKVDPK